MSDLKPTGIRYSIPYDDNSGDRLRVEYGVCDAQIEHLEIECIDKVNIPANDLDWLINALSEIQKIRAKQPPTGRSD